MIREPAGRLLERMCAEDLAECLGVVCGMYREWANLTGNYADVDDYARMCVSCHRNFDAARRRLTGRRTSPKRR